MMLLSCNEQNHNHKHDKAEAAAVEKQHQETGPENLELNNGQKWKADSSTNQNVIFCLRSLISSLQVLTNHCRRTELLQQNCRVALIR